MIRAAISPRLATRILRNIGPSYENCGGRSTSAIAQETVDLGDVGLRNASALRAAFTSPAGFPPNRPLALRRAMGRHETLDVVRLARQTVAQIAGAGLGHEHVVLDP